MNSSDSDDDFDQSLYESIQPKTPANKLIRRILSSDEEKSPVKSDNLIASLITSDSDELSDECFDETQNDLTENQIQTCQSPPALQKSSDNDLSITSLEKRNSLFSSTRVASDIINTSSSGSESDKNDIIESDSDIIEGDSDEVFAQTLHQSDPIIIEDSASQSEASAKESPFESVHEDSIPAPIPASHTEEEQKIEVASSEYFKQRDDVDKLKTDLQQARRALSVTKFTTLVDNGASLRQHIQKIEAQLSTESRKLERMVVSQVDNAQAKVEKVFKIDWDNLKTGTSSVVPKTFGKTAMNTYNTQKALTLDLLQEMHQSLETAPTDKTLAEDPKGLKIDLMPHQKRALAWLLWREKQKPSGGILADDMGLGKTLTMISLVLKSNEILRAKKDNYEEEESSSDDENDNPNGRSVKRKPKPLGGTLVICPATLINQWSCEIDNRVKRGLISYEVFHGTKRETKAARLAHYDMVITTYGVASQKDIIDRIKWRRIILDEAHTIRNHRTKSSISICELLGKSRWAVTGTPVHNKELDMYSLLKFLRCSPFDDLGVWKRWVGSKSAGGTQRLHTVSSSLMLRRTKEELKIQGALECVPQRQWQIIDIKLAPNEMAVYQKMLLFSRNLFAQYLHQKAQKDMDLRSDLEGMPPNAEYFKMRDKLLKMNKIQDVNASHILVLLLRLRQICCHPHLISAGVSEDMDVADESKEEIDIMEQLNNLQLSDNEEDEYKGEPVPKEEQENVGLTEASKNIFNKNNPVFAPTYQSSKMSKMIEMVRDKIMPTDEKTIIVSQWPTYLRIAGEFLKEEGIHFSQLDGSVPVNKRMDMVNDFNNPKHKVRVLLLSLTAGGVGLNLIGANHLILMDLHWNPQLENQAQDRIYRVGQKKTVFVYKFLVNETIEERILKLQDDKKNLAQQIMTGSKHAMSSKLTLNDMRTLFNM